MTLDYIFRYCLNESQRKQMANDLARQAFSIYIRRVEGMERKAGLRLLRDPKFRAECKRAWKSISEDRVLQWYKKHKIVSSNFVPTRASDWVM